MKRLFTKIIILYVVFFALAFGTIATFFYRKTYQDIAQQEAYKLYTQATSIASTHGFRYYTNTLGLDSLKYILDLSAKNLSSDIWIVNSDGSVLVSTQESANSAQIQNFDMRRFSDTYYQIGDFYSFFETPHLTVCAPITANYDVVGYVFIHESTEEFADLVNSSIDSTYEAMFVVFAFALIPLIGGYLLTIKPLKNIVSISAEYNMENFKPELSSQSQDEIGYIANTMGFMANKLDTQEDVQRKFISNISHDFRSPLTSIRGYLEAMNDGTIPVELYPKYINIILNETERLTKLTNNLLDLNRIGSKGAHLEYSDFDINEIIRKCALSCEVQCEKKDLSVELDLYDGTMFVHADESKIQQVIYNLLDNAIKFSKPSTSIKIETVRKNDKLMVSIKDHGIGIPKDALDNIWNRFYKSDLSRGKDKKGTGLGLSIVKEIIQAHEQSINVVSTVDVGTEFIFTLALSEKELEQDIV